MPPRSSKESQSLAVEPLMPTSRASSALLRSWADRSAAALTNRSKSRRLPTRS